jgi:hypothetical protein
MRMTGHSSSRFLRADGDGACRTRPRHRPRADVKHAHGVREHRAARPPRAGGAGHGCHSVTSGRRAPCLHDVGPRRRANVSEHADAWCTARASESEPGGWLTAGPQHFRGLPDKSASQFAILCSMETTTHSRDTRGRKIVVWLAIFSTRISTRARRLPEDTETAELRSRACGSRRRSL